MHCKALGCNVLTGDRYLLAAEAGAEFSGMEFSNAYSLAPAFCIGNEVGLLQLGKLYVRGRYDHRRGWIIKRLVDYRQNTFNPTRICLIGQSRREHEAVDAQGSA